MKTPNATPKDVRTQALEFEPTSQAVKSVDLASSVKWWKTLSQGQQKTFTKNYSLKTFPDVISLWKTLGYPLDGKNLKDPKKGDQK